MVGAVEPGSGDLEDYGYCLERAVLAATDLGLGTCWLGGTFNKSSFARKIDIAEGEVMPAVIAMGYPTETSRNTLGPPQRGQRTPPAAGAALLRQAAPAARWMPTRRAT